jgi:hypothetical protein
MSGTLRALAAPILGTAVAFGAALAIFAWPVIFAPEFMIVWG